MPDTEEVPQWHIDAGRLLAVVIHAQADQAGPCEFVIGYGDPDVINDAQGPRRSAMTNVSPGMMRLLSSLLGM